MSMITAATVIRLICAIALLWLTWTGTGLADSEVGFAVYEYSLTTLFNQQNHCPPFGPRPDGGCDQCLAYASPEGWFQETFCSIDRPCTGSLECLVCNGTCRIETFTQYVNNFHESAMFVTPQFQTTDAAIGGCHQWVWDDYCTWNGNVEPGAYKKTFEFEISAVIPPRVGSYAYLDSDPDWNAARQSLTQDYPAGGDFADEAWRTRVGLITMILSGVPAGPQGRSNQSPAFWRRALFCALWELTYEHVDGHPTQFGFPSDVPPPAVVEDIRDMWRSTCRDLMFQDCSLTAVEPATWGGIKSTYR